MWVTAVTETAETKIRVMAVTETAENMSYNRNRNCQKYKLWLWETVPKLKYERRYFVNFGAETVTEIWSGSNIY